MLDGRSGPRAHARIVRVLWAMDELSGHIKAMMARKEPDVNESPGDVRRAKPARSARPAQGPAVPSPGSVTLPARRILPGLPGAMGGAGGIDACMPGNLPRALDRRLGPEFVLYADAVAFARTPGAPMRFVHGHSAGPLRGELLFLPSASVGNLRVIRDIPPGCRRARFRRRGAGWPTTPRRWRSRCRCRASRTAPPRQ